jgi:hypothetical protein
MQITLMDKPLVVPTGGALGAEIRGVDLRRLDDDAFTSIQRAWLDNLVLLNPVDSVTLERGPRRLFRIIRPAVQRKPIKWVKAFTRPRSLSEPSVTAPGVIAYPAHARQSAACSSRRK